MIVHQDPILYPTNRIQQCRKLFKNILQIKIETTTQYVPLEYLFMVYIANVWETIDSGIKKDNYKYVP